MTTTTQLILKLQSLTEDQQRQVLDFIEHLAPVPRPSRRSLYGIWKGHDTPDDVIAEARTEMWGQSRGEGPG